MKTRLNVLYPAAAVMILSLLLLAGCRQGKTKENKKPPIEQKQVTVDSNEEDTMEVFCERMRRWEILHGGASRRESDK